MTQKTSFKSRMKQAFSFFCSDHYISRLKASQDGNLPALMQAKDAAMVEA